MIHSCLAFWLKFGNPWKSSTCSSAIFGYTSVSSVILDIVGVFGNFRKPSVQFFRTLGVPKIPRSQGYS